MNRTEFLAALSLRLEDLAADEREEAVKYYSEYLDEVGMDGEDAAIAELGGAEKVSNIIRANCGLGPYRPADKATAKPELTLDSPSYSQAVENTVQSSQAAAQAANAQAAAQAAQAAQTAQQAQKKQPVPPTYTPSNPAGTQAASATAANTATAASTAPADAAASTSQAQTAAPRPATPPVYTNASGNPFAGQAPDARNVYNAAGAAAQDASAVPPTYGAGTMAPPTYSGTQPRYNQNNNRILWILIIVASSPIWLGLLGGAIGLVFGIFGTFIGLLASGFGMLIAGVVHAVLAVPLFLTSPGTALATIGMSLLAAGIGALLGSGMVLACSKVFPFIGRMFSRLIGWVRGKVSGR